MTDTNNFQTFLKLWGIALSIFLAIDLVWLGIVAKSFYAQQLGFLMRPSPNWFIAIPFYMLFMLGLVYFAIVPAGAINEALFRGAFFGLVTYGTYDLTNLATLERWPALVTVVDLIWGTILAGTVAALTYWIGLHLIKGTLTTKSGFFIQ